MHVLLSGRLAICHAESHRPQPTKHKYMLLAEKKMEEIERKNARLGTLPGESPVECHLAQPPNQPRKCTKHDKTSDNQTYTHASC